MLHWQRHGLLKLQNPFHWLSIRLSNEYDKKNRPFGQNSDHIWSKFWSWSLESGTVVGPIVREVQDRAAMQEREKIGRRRKSSAQP